MTVWAFALNTISSMAEKIKQDTPVNVSKKVEEINQEILRKKLSLKKFTKLDAAEVLNTDTHSAYRCISSLVKSKEVIVFKSERKNELYRYEFVSK